LRLDCASSNPRFEFAVAKPVWLTSQGDGGVDGGGLWQDIRNWLWLFSLCQLTLLGTSSSSQQLDLEALGECLRLLNDGQNLKLHIT